MNTIYTEAEIALLREGGKRLASVLREVAQSVRPGITTLLLDQIAERLIRQLGDTPAFLHYKPAGARFPYPRSLCVSVNNEVVHGIPGSRVLKEGDIVGLDLGITHKGLVTDMAVTVGVDTVDETAKKLINITREALAVGIAAARGGARVGDIGHAIETFVKPYGYGVIEVLGGHGVGHKVHEDPYIPNVGRKGTGPILKPGQVLALEPMLNEGSKEVYLDDDGYTFKTADDKRSAHFEHTILITEGAAEILTEL
ncbi:MAG: type I methionyl aminopeptidase [Patescibacteria group bacterium]|nr:type I methionyl aminopeptidase [Patescibacteria group bacterium]